MNKRLLFILPILLAINCFSQNYEKIKASKNCYKPIEYSNPISSVLFCADPTGIEYNGRLYIYGTSDHQEYQFAGINGKNTYSQIKSIVIFSTEDMVNWQYEGAINVKDVAPWTINSWAPSICSRVEEDGLTHFYLYYSNNGCGVGVITATNPVGSWSDPRGSALIMSGDPRIGDVPNPFDPGVCIDENGIGWLGFGGGKAQNGTDAMPRTARIARLGKDMISLDTIVEIKAPYLFEASELNYINGTYLYTFNNNWAPRTEWDFKQGPEPSQCSMSYMTSKTPLVTDSWKYRGHYFPNPGDMGLCYSNNHTHLMKYHGQYYLFYHTMALHSAMKSTKDDLAFRSLCVDVIKIDENKTKISMVKGTKEGVQPIQTFSPYIKHNGTNMATSADIDFDTTNNIVSSKSIAEGAWIAIRNVDFNMQTKHFACTAKGIGTIEIRLDKLNSEPIATTTISGDSIQNYSCDATIPEGIHNVYILFSKKDMYLINWLFE